jgi:hypothetical protein
MRKMLLLLSVIVLFVSGCTSLPYGYSKKGEEISELPKDGYVELYYKDGTLFKTATYSHSKNWFLGYILV